MQPDFLSHAERDALAAVMLADTGELAGIFGDDLEGKANPEVRRAWEVDVPEHLTALVEARMSAVRPALEAHFGARLREPDGLAYLRYPPGAFYRAHRDRRATPDSSNTHLRAVSVVLFVNDPRGNPAYSGGQLRFYGVLGEGPLEDVGLDAEPEGGTLVAFPSTVLHEVTPVFDGVRFSVVTWFLDD